MFNLAFVKAAVERAVGAFAAPVVGALVATGTDVFEVPWRKVFGLAAAAAVASLMASVGKAGVGPEGPGLTETTAKPSAVPGGER